MWSDDDDIDDEEIEHGNASVESPPICDEIPATDTTTQSLVRWLLAFFLLLQAQFHLTDRVVSKIFRFLKTFFVVLGRVSAPCAAIGSQLPQTFYLAQKGYKKKLKRSSIQYVSSVVLYGNTMTALKVMVYIKELSFVHTYQSLVVVIEDESAMASYFRPLK